MEARPENAASIAVELSFQSLRYLHLIDLKDAVHIGSEGHVAGFVNEDRRRLGVLDGLDVGQTVESLFALADLADGDPVWRTPVIAVRGDRVVLHGGRVDLPEGSGLEHRTVRLYTQDMKVARAIHFDVDHEHEAFVMLNQLHAEHPEPAHRAAVERLKSEWSRSSR